MFGQNRGIAPLMKNDPVTFLQCNTIGLISKEMPESKKNGYKAALLQLTISM
jgi:hypothetical protein